MSGFIPMVSTTPPPMDGPPDDDFTDFVEGSMDETESDSYMDQSIPSFSPTFSPIKKPNLPLVDQVNHNNETNLPFSTKHIEDEFDDFAEFHESSTNGYEPSQEDNSTDFSITHTETDNIKTTKDDNVQLNHHNSHIETQETSNKINLFDDSNFITNDVTVGNFQNEISENNSNEFEEYKQENLNKYAASDSEPGEENEVVEIANENDISFGAFGKDNQLSSDVISNNGIIPPNEIQQTNTPCDNNTENENTHTSFNEGTNALNPINDNSSVENIIEDNVNETKTTDTGTAQNDDDFGTFSDEEVVLPTVNNDTATNGTQVKVNITEEDVESENSFGAFSDEDDTEVSNVKSSYENQVKQQQDNDDDFGKFSDEEDNAANENHNEMTDSCENVDKLNGVSQVEEPREDFEEFGNFNDSFQSTTDVKVESEETQKDIVEDDFGNFSDDDDDDFGNFDDIQSFPTNQPLTQPPQQSTKSIHDKISSVSGQYTTTGVLSANDEDSEPLPPLQDWIHEDILELNKDENREDDNAMVWAGDIWENLEDIDNTAALSFVWNGSQHNKGLLQSLGLDINHITDGQITMFSGKNKAYYVPSYYAIGLDTMDYNKGILKPMSAAEKITAISPKDKTAPVNALSADAGLTEDWATAEEEQIEDIGPVIDPLSFDVDFLETHEAQTNPSSSVPSKADLMDPSLLELSTAPTIDLPPVKDTGSAKLSKLLASLKTSSSSPVASSQTGSVLTSDEEETLSAEAKEVIKKLPDLSYMRSKVLMFPVNIMTRVKMSDQ